MIAVRYLRNTSYASAFLHLNSEKNLTFHDYSVVSSCTHFHIVAGQKSIRVVWSYFEKNCFDEVACRRYVDAFNDSIDRERVWFGSATVCTELMLQGIKVLHVTPTAKKPPLILSISLRCAETLLYVFGLVHLSRKKSDPLKPPQGYLSYKW